MTNNPTNPYRMSAPPIIRQLGWKTVKELIETETVKMVYRSINHEASEYLTVLFQRLYETCARQLRNTSTDLYVPFLKTEWGYESSMFKATVIPQKRKPAIMRRKHVWSVEAENPTTIQTRISIKTKRFSHMVRGSSTVDLL